jgi:hypothetical protein
VAAEQGFIDKNDLEAVHDNISRNANNWRGCTIDVGAGAITFVGITPNPLIHEFADS